MTAYLVARVRVSDEESYKRYAALASKAIERHKGKVLARGGKYVTLEGDEFPRTVIIAFESMEKALAYYHSPEYQEAKIHAVGAAVRHMCIVEGVD